MEFNISYKYQSIYKEKNYGLLLEAKILLRKNTTFTYSGETRTCWMNEDYKIKYLIYTNPTVYLLFDFEFAPEIDYLLCSTLWYIYESLYPSTFT